MSDENPKGRRKPIARRAVLVIAAAAVVWLVLPEGDPGPVPRGENPLTCVSPVGEAAEVGRFEWTYDLPEGGSFELRLYDDSYAVLGSVPALTDTHYALDESVAARLPERFTWEVFARDAEGSDLGSCRAEVVRV